MPDLVTAEEAKVQLRLDTGTADDVWLAIWIPAISEAVLGWLKDEWRAYVPEVDSGGAVLDSSGNPVPALPLTARPVVRGAVLLELESVYRFRGGEGTENVVTPDAGYGYVLNKASTALLAPLRRSTIA